MMCIFFPAGAVSYFENLLLSRETGMKKKFEFQIQQVLDFF